MLNTQEQNNATITQVILSKEVLESTRDIKPTKNQNKAYVYPASRTCR
jgi:hypothetical protein